MLTLDKAHNSLLDRVDNGAELGIFTTWECHLEEERKPFRKKETNIQSADWQGNCNPHLIRLHYFQGKTPVYDSQYC